MATIETNITQAFRDAFESHPARHEDPALALESARETAAELIPDGVTGDFDDEALAFTADKYEIVTRHHAGEEWTADGVGDPNVFYTEAAAESAIRSLVALGGEWAECDYAVRDIEE